MAAISPTGPGCYVEEADYPVASDGYDPQFYDGYLVYYDDGGRPYCYENGMAVWVPVGSPFYFGFVNHWRAHRQAYVRWRARYGHRYPSYRRGYDRHRR